MRESETNEIRDFEKKNNKAVERISIRERRLQRKSMATKLADSETLSMLVLFAAIAAAIIVILVSIMVLKIPAITVCVIIVLEAAIAACLQNVPIWIHGLVVIIQGVAGYFTENSLFVVLCIVIYLLVSFAVRFMRKQY